MARASTLFMIFIPCRPVGAWRIRLSTAKWAEDGMSVEVQAKEKMDRGKGAFMFLLHRGKIPNLCPVAVYVLLCKEAERRGLQDIPWGSEKGIPHKQPSAISRHVKLLLLEAKIPSCYATYSILHALITALFAKGLSEPEVNAYTRHSNNAHTDLIHYFHMDEKWAGNDLANFGDREIPAPAAKLIYADNVLLQADLHKKGDTSPAVE
jgi:hypothetical protein